MATDTGNGNAIEVTTPFLINLTVAPFCQTWLIGNTVSDVLIAAGMLYHVSRFHIMW